MNQRFAKRTRQTGFTLIELMISVAIIAVIAAIGVPMYNDYVQTGREGALINSMATIEVFEEDVRLRTGSYASGTYDVAGGNTSLTDNVGWQPSADDGSTYVVVANAGISYRVTATDAAGTSLCRVYPAKTPCP